MIGVYFDRVLREHEETLHSIETDELLHRLGTDVVSDIYLNLLTAGEYM